MRPLPPPGPPASIPGCGSERGLSEESAGVRQGGFVDVGVPFF